MMGHPDADCPIPLQRRLPRMTLRLVSLFRVLLQVVCYRAYQLLHKYDVHLVPAQGRHCTTM